ncbi:MAG: pyridoxal 5'-phosphate synthase glutaminase subunit PdxT [Actinomycetota bacterium]|nr:pyridoxal 5'-phosphate synthase glutaminase subunit PdxT [Actinomycetota bacterium]
MARVGVLALQGDFREHAAVLESLGAEAVLVRKPEDLEGLDALIIPGGESTTIGRLASLYGLLEPLRRRIEEGLPTLGTCAGMIFLAGSITHGEQPQLRVLDLVVERNAFGRQAESFEEDLAVEGLGSFHGVFIRAPWVAKIGGEVEVLAESQGHPVMVRQGNVLGTSFHPELTDDGRIHQLLLDMAGED